MRPLLIGAGLPMLIAVACETVDLGQPPSDINACRPSQTYYVCGPGGCDSGGVTDAGMMNRGIWTEILTKDYGGKHCSDQACHGAASTNPLKLTMPGCLPFTGCSIPIPLTQEWAANYRATTEEMNCSNVMASKLIEYPGGIQPGHAGGKLFEPDGPEASIIIGWVSALP
jgi:hypothetical protein